MHEFLTALNLPQLRHLSLPGRPVGARAARLLTQEKFRTLTRLDLTRCGLSDPVVSELVTAPALQNLVELRLGQNWLKKGVAPLADRGVLPRLGLVGGPDRGHAKPGNQCTDCKRHKNHDDVPHFSAFRIDDACAPGSGLGLGPGSGPGP